MDNDDDEDGDDDNHHHQQQQPEQDPLLIQASDVVTPQSVQIQIQPDMGHMMNNNNSGHDCRTIILSQEAARIGCDYCYHVFKTPQALARHVHKFHGVV